VSVAFVVKEEAGSGPLTFPGFPGVWSQSQPIEAQAFIDAGIFVDADEMIARVVELGLPLEQIKVKAGAAPLPERENHVAAVLEAVSEPEPEATPLEESES
jgi:hypothetical protein